MRAAAIRILSAAVIAAAVPAAAFAQETVRVERSAPSQVGSARYVTVGGPDFIMAKDLVGHPVYTEADEEVGKVTELVISDRARIAALVVDVGGRNVAVNYARFNVHVSDNGGRKLVVKDGLARLSDAPAYRQYQDAPDAAGMKTSN